MAFELGNRRVQDTENFRENALGLKLPIQRGNNGMFAQNFTTIDQARSNVKNLLQTRKGERVMQPNFGSGLHSLIFEQLEDPDFEDRVITEIESALEMWIPYVTLDTVEIDLSNNLIDRNRANVTLSFTVGDDIETNTVTFIVE